MLETSHYDEATADYVVNFIGCLCHTKGRWAGKPFDLLPWQEQIIRDIFGTLKPNGKRQFTTAYIEIPKKNGKSDTEGWQHDRRDPALLRRYNENIHPIPCRKRAAPDLP